MPEPQRPLKVFLSYASQDKPTVRELSRRLVGEGWIDTWLDEKNLLPGHDWRVKIEEAVEESDIVIICLSSNSVTKEGYVQKELRYAREIALEKPEDSIFLIPLRLDECEVPRGLRFYQWVDYFEDKKDSSYEALVASLKQRYEQKLRVEKEERLRKEKQEREAAEQAAREKAEKEAEERQRIAREKAERKDAEQKQKEQERRETSERDISVDLGDKEIKQGIWKSIKDIKPVYLFVVFVALVLFSVVLFTSLSRPSQVLEETPVVTTTLTETIEPTETPKPTLIPTNALSPTPLPNEITDAKGVSMVLVQAGEFTMGSDYSENEEHPKHQVYLDDFYMDTYEVTNELYKNCIDDYACTPPKEVSSKNRNNYFDNPEFNEFPVVNVNWEQAKTYCEWRGGYLPTEAQWEKAARGTDERIYPWGDNISCDYANYYNGTKYCVLETTKVGSYDRGKSIYGIYDLAGNVWEWVADWYDEKYYQNSPFENPSGPENGKERVFRGGAWDNHENLIYAFIRNKSEPKYSYDILGFRCAKSANP